MKKNIISPSPKMLELAGILGAGALVVALVNSCTSLHEHPLFNGASDPKNAKNDLPKLYTEAYLEFAGPSDRWAGPATWIMHVKATNPPEITITPQPTYEAPPATPAIAPSLAKADVPAKATELTAPIAPHVERVPAGVSAVTPIGSSSVSGSPSSATPVVAANVAVPANATTAPPVFTAELVRARLAQLDQWTTPPTTQTAPDFHSCLSPMRVKLVRADGVVTERRGCRMQSAWSTQVSSLASELTAYYVKLHGSHAP